MLEAEKELDKLIHYIDHYAQRRVNEELVGLHHYIISFDQWYEAGTNFKRNELISNCGRRNTGRTRAMVENVIMTLQKSRDSIYIKVKNVNHREQILHEFDKLVTISKTQRSDIFTFKEFPYSKLEFGFMNREYNEMLYRGRHEFIVFHDHWSYESDTNYTNPPKLKIYGDEVDYLKDIFKSKMF